MVGTKVVNSTSALADTGITTTYLYGQGLICEELEGLYLYHHYNNLGSTMKLTDAEGTVVASYTYGAYGELLSGNPAFTHYLYNGRCGVSTEENGLYYMRQRYYNPEIKRFVNRDILTGSVENSQSLNRYSYVQGNPVSYTDPFGLSPLNGLFSGTNFAHAVFGLLSCVPGGIGAAASAVDAAIYLFVDKDYGMAALCAMNVAAFGFGKAASLMAKGGSLTHTAQTLRTTSSLLSHTASFGMNARAGMAVGFDMYDKYVIQGKPMDSGTILEFGMLGMSVGGGIISGKGVLSETKQLGNMLGSASYMNAMKEEVCGFMGGVKESITPVQNKGGVVIGGGNTGSVSDAARNWQLETGDYGKTDAWTDITLSKGSKVWSGSPGQSSFYTSDVVAELVGNDATKLYQGLQVGKGNYPTYRAGFTMYEVREDITVAYSKALANNQISEGGFDQYFIPNYEKVLKPVMSRIMTNR